MWVTLQSFARVFCTNMPPWWASHTFILPMRKSMSWFAVFGQAVCMLLSSSKAAVCVAAAGLCSCRGQDTTVSCTVIASFARRLDDQLLPVEVSGCRWRPSHLHASPAS